MAKIDDRTPGRKPIHFAFYMEQELHDFIQGRADAEGKSFSLACKEILRAEMARAEKAARRRKKGAE